jgi:DNA-binding CsgD family transcriptional regulator
MDRWLRGSLSRVSDADVLKALEAQSPAEAIAEILVATPEARAAAENDWSELLLRGAEAKNRIAELVGGLLSSSEAAAILGISVPGVKQRMDRHKLLAVPLSGGQWGFPALQFDAGGHVRPGIPEIARAGAGVDAWTALSILVDDVPDGSGVLLERLDDPAVLRDSVQRLESYGEHVAA